MVYDTENQTKDIIKEYEIVKKLGVSKNCLQYVTSGKYINNNGKKAVVFISDLVPGYDLEKIIYSDIKLSLLHIKWIMAQIFCGLETIHDTNIFHSDIKPSNIMISDNMKITIIDFGTSHNIGDTAAAQDFKSTFTYTTTQGVIDGINSFEKKNNVKITEDHKKNDIWAAGCVLYELWTRNILFESFSEQSQLKFIEEFVINVIGGKKNLFTNNTVNPSNDEKEIFDFFLFIMNTDTTPPYKSQAPTVGEILKHPWLSPFVDINKE